MPHIDGDALRHRAAEQAATIIDVADDELLAAHGEAARALVKFGLMLAGRGLDAGAVLAQMMQPAAIAFASGVLPRYVLEVEIPDDGGE